MKVVFSKQLFHVTVHGKDRDSPHYMVVFVGSDVFKIGVYDCQFTRCQKLSWVCYLSSQGEIFSIYLLLLNL